jgi:hypothetical protein
LTQNQLSPKIGSRVLIARESVEKSLFEREAINGLSTFGLLIWQHIPRLIKKVEICFPCACHFLFIVSYLLVRTSILKSLNEPNFSLSIDLIFRFLVIAMSAFGGKRPPDSGDMPVYKIIVIGDGGVGKSSLTVQFFQVSFSSNLNATITMSNLSEQKVLSFFSNLMFCTFFIVLRQ